MNYFTLYLLLINFISLLSMWIDKKKAIHHKYRISESTLIGLAILGGSLGSLIGMYLFHHKTKKKKFYLSIPILLLLQFIFFYYMYI